MATATDSFDLMASDAVLSRSDTKSLTVRKANDSRPNTQQIAYLVALRNATGGWTPETRKTYFSWFPRVRSWQGGGSYKGFMEAALAEAIANIAPEGEIAELQALSAAAPSAPADIVPPKGPGKIYTLDETVRLAQGGLRAATSTTAETCTARSAPSAILSAATVAALAPTSPAAAIATPFAT